MNVRAQTLASRDQTLSLIILLVIGGLLFMFDLVGVLKPLRNIGDYIANPVLYWTRQATVGVNQLTQSVTAWATLKDENISLRKEVIDLRAQQVQADDLKKENEALRKQLKVSTNKPLKYILARPLAYDIGDQVGTIKINQGEGQGVRTGELVIYDNYFVGFVSETSARSSLVKTVFASGVELKGKLANNRTKGIVTSQSNELIFKDVLATNPLAQNDLVLLWDEGYPLDVIIGQVGSIERQKASPYQLAKLKPLLEYADVDYLFVVRNE